MASKITQKRTATPAPLMTYPKQIFTVEEWEARAPLDDKELRSINIVKKGCEERKLPTQVLAVGNPASRPSTPTFRHKLAAPGTPSRPTTPSNFQLQTKHPLHPKHPVQTPQQLYDWFALIDSSVTHSQEAHFRAHLAGVSDHLKTCDQLIERVDDVQREVEDMFEGWSGVEEGGKSLKNACEVLLDERDRLLQLTDAIAERLEYFQELEHDTRILNHPGESLVLQTDFLDMVERVDICIDFLRAHRHFREAEIYLLRFQQCMTRAMTLIKMYFLGSLKALATDISKRLVEKEVSDTAQMHLLYTRFRSVSTQLAPLLGELERRTLSHPEDLSSLLHECHAAYFSTRKNLLMGRLAEEIKGLDPVRTELVELTRAGCSYLKQLCIDEFALYRGFFNSGSEQLYQYLENLCDYLYDDLRPRILHEPRLTALCEVCTVLQALMVLDIPTGPDSLSGDEEDDNERDELTVDLDKGKRKGLGELHISHLLQTVLQDAQTRLFFKAQSIVQSEIRYYVPKPDDLDYPSKLAVAQKPTNGLTIKEKEIDNLFLQLPSLEKRETWYPTLTKTVWVLTQLHDFVQPTIFDDIAQEAVNLCRASLVAASDMIAAKNSPSTKFDGQLFLVRHLLILKEMTNNLNLVHRDGNGPIDLKHVTETVKDILRTSSLMPYALAASFSKTREDVNIADPREGIDYDLKRSCEEVIADCTDSISHGIIVFVDKVHNTHQHTGPQQIVPQQKGLFPKDKIMEVDKDFRLAMQKELPGVAVRLRLYLDDSGTVAVLLTHIQNKVIEAYSAFREAAWALYGHEIGTTLLSVDELGNVLNDLCQNGIIQ